jgi:Na+/melibiose symporter-like transporter
VIVLVMYLMAFVATDAVGSIVVFYVRNYLGRGSEVSFVTGTLLVSQVASLPFYTVLSKRTSKRTGYIAGGVLWVVVMLLSFAITPSHPAFVMYVFAALVGLGTGGIVVMVYAIFPDIPDVDELRSGRRREGTYAAIFTFMRKLSSAVALFLVAQAIDLAGYTPPLEQVVDGATRLVQQPQRDSFILVLRLVFALMPVFFVLVGLLFAARYPLTHPVHQRLSTVLAARRSGGPVDETEARGLERLLFGKVRSP